MVNSKTNIVMTTDQQNYLSALRLDEVTPATWDNQQWQRTTNGEQVYVTVLQPNGLTRQYRVWVGIQKKQTGFTATYWDGVKIQPVGRQPSCETAALAKRAVRLNFLAVFPGYQQPIEELENKTHQAITAAPMDIAVVPNQCVEPVELFLNGLLPTVVNKGEGLTRRKPEATPVQLELVPRTAAPVPVIAQVATEPEAAAIDAGLVIKANSLYAQIHTVLVGDTEGEYTEQIKFHTSKTGKVGFERGGSLTNSLAVAAREGRLNVTTDIDQALAKLGKSKVKNDLLGIVDQVFGHELIEPQSVGRFITEVLFGTSTLSEFIATLSKPEQIHIATSLGVYKILQAAKNITVSPNSLIPA